MAAPYSAGTPVVPPHLAPVMEAVAQRLSAMQQGQADASAAYAPVVQQVQNQTLPPDALAPLPPDISNGKAALAIALSNLGSALSSASGVRGLGADPNAAFQTVLSRRGERRAVQRENAKTTGAFAIDKQNKLTDLAAKQADTGVSLGAQELARQQNEQQFNEEMKFKREQAITDEKLRKQEMEIRLAIAKMQTDSAEGAAAKALAEQQAAGLGRDMGLVLATMRTQAASGNGTFQVYLPDRSLTPEEAARAPKDPTTGLPMRMFTSRAGVESYMDGMLSSLSPALQASAKKMWMDSSAPVWDMLEKQQKAFQADAMKRAEAAAKEKLAKEAKQTEMNRAALRTMSKRI